MRLAGSATMAAGPLCRLSSRRIVRTNKRLKSTVAGRAPALGWVSSPAGSRVSVRELPMVASGVRTTVR